MRKLLAPRWILILPSWKKEITWFICSMALGNTLACKCCLQERVAGEIITRGQVERLI